jgi:hypothetical protein
MLIIFPRVKKIVFWSNTQGDSLFNLLMPASPTSPRPESKNIICSGTGGGAFTIPTLFLSMTAAAGIVLHVVHI